MRVLFCSYKFFKEQQQHGRMSSTQYWLTLKTSVESVMILFCVITATAQKFLPKEVSQQMSVNIYRF